MNVLKAWAVVALAAGLGAAAVVHPATVPSPRTDSFAVAPMPAQAVCPGPQRLPVGDQGGSGDLAAGTDDRMATDVGVGGSLPVGHGRAWDSPVAGAWEVVNDGDLQGIAAVTCQVAARDVYLVGGSTSVGASTRLVLSNAAAAPSEATVTVYGPLGQATDAFTVAVGSHSQEERLLEAVAGQQSGLVVHVVSTGPGVSAVLQDARLDGFQPAGAEWVAATQPASRLVIPAVGSAVEGSWVTVRLFAPDGAVASVSLVTSSGVQAWSGARALTLEPGVVTDVQVPAPGPGAVEITADAPLVAGAMTTVPRAADEGSEGAVAADLMWVAGMPDEAAPRAVVVPAPGGRLAVYSQVGGTAVFTDAQGVTVASVRVPARTVVLSAVDVPVGTMLTLDGPFAWALTYATDEGYVAALTPVEVGAEDHTVTVRGAPYGAS